VEGVATVGSGFVTATVLGTFQGADGIVAIIDKVLAVPPTPSKVIRMYDVPFFPATQNFTEYFNSLNFLNSYTL
jgi:hypothetical protein